MKKISVLLAVLMLFLPLLTACQNNDAQKPAADAGPSDPVITLGQKTCTLTVGDTYQVSYTVDPEGTPVEYLSSDSQVVSVDSTGKITAVGVGNASVAVSAGEYSRGYMDVTVMLPAAPSIPGIQLSSESLELITGSEYSLTASVRNGANTLADVSLTWNSLNTAVATVDGGKVTAVAPGATEIIVSAQVSGEEIQISCPVTVIDYYEVSLDQTLIDAPMGESFTVSATVKDAAGQVIQPQAGELEYFTTDPAAISVSGTTFKVIGLSPRIPAIGVRYKGNVATIPVEIFSVTADFFDSGCTNYGGTVDGVTFSGVLYYSSAYQPKYYLTQSGLDQLNSYAAEHGYTTLRMHVHPILLNNALVLNNAVWTTNKEWNTVDIPLSRLSTSYEFWSQSEGISEIYMWFELR